MSEGISYAKGKMEHASVIAGQIEEFEWMLLFLSRGNCIEQAKGIERKVWNRDVLIEFDCPQNSTYFLFEISLYLNFLQHNSNVNAEKKSVV